MIYAFAFLLFVLSLVTGATVFPRFLRMRKIRANGAVATGYIAGWTGVDAHALGGMVSAVTGKVSYPEIHYRSADDKEHMIEIIDVSVFKIQRIAAGDTIEVVYDKDAPWRAYVQTEWNKSIRDLWLAGAELLAAGFLWAIGVAFNLPA